MELHCPFCADMGSSVVHPRVRYPGPAAELEACTCAIPCDEPHRRCRMRAAGDFPSLYHLVLVAAGAGVLAFHWVDWLLGRLEGAAWALPHPRAVSRGGRLRGRHPARAA